MRLYSTKLSAREKRASIYPYYAGFSVDFVSSVLKKLSASSSSRILDPWNGTGTTTYAAARISAVSMGIEINPALLSVARARIATAEQRATAQSALEMALTHLERSAPDQVSLPRVYATSTSFLPANASDPTLALLQCALFPAVRRHFQELRTKNPSWFSSPKASAAIVEQPVSLVDLRASAEGVFSRHQNSEIAEPKAPTFLLADTTRLPSIRRRFDILISSPPYLTRIDYVQATLPELSLLESAGVTIPTQLRRLMLGTPLTGPVDQDKITPLPNRARAILQRILNHPSKASATYYHRFFSLYFIGLMESLKRICPLLTPQAKACFVVQPSHYKEIFIDLPAILVEMGESLGLALDEIWDFDAKNSMASVNSRSHVLARKPLSESAIFFNNRRAT